MAKIIDTGLYEVVIVSPRNFFLFTPMLSGSAVGTVEYRSITEPIRQANPIAGKRARGMTVGLAHTRLTSDADRSRLLSRLQLQTTTRPTARPSSPRTRR